MNHQKIERQADEAYAEFMRQWSRAIRADAGEPTHVEVWHHAWRAALAAAPAQEDGLTAAYFAGSHDAKRARKPLTDEQIEQLAEEHGSDIDGFARAIEAAHGITKTGGVV